MAKRWSALSLGKSITSLRGHYRIHEGGGQPRRRAGRQVRVPSQQKQMMIEPKLEERDNLYLPARLDSYVLALGPGLVVQQQLEYHFSAGLRG